MKKLHPTLSAKLEGTEYHRVFQASPDYMTFTRLSDGTFIDVNPGFEKTIGYTRDEVLGKTGPEIGLWPDGTDEREKFVQALIREGSLQEYLLHFRRRNGEIFPVEMTATIVELNGEQVLVAVAKDITQRVQSEAELRQYRNQLEQLVEERTAALQIANDELLKTNDQLEEAHNHLLQSEKMASIGQLAAGVAHEINNPVGFVNSNLGSLENYLHSLIRVIDAYDTHARQFSVQFPDAMKSIESIKVEVELEYLKEDVFSLLRESKDGLLRVKRIVQDLKDFSHADTGEWLLADLHAGLDSTLNIVNNEIKYKANIVKEYGKLPPVECLPLEINQVFMNMLVNAAHAIKESGEIVIRTGVQDKMVWVEFSDTGSGISAENVKRIFDPFFTTKPVGQGTGLGLSLSYGIVQKHKGRIEVDSTLGKGTRFRIWLAISQAQAPP